MKHKEENIPQTRRKRRCDRYLATLRMQRTTYYAK